MSEKPYKKKSPRKKLTKKKKDQIATRIMCLCLVTLVVGITLFFIIGKKRAAKQEQEDYAYIHEYIDTNYGNGEHLNIIREHDENLTKQELSSWDSPASTASYLGKKYSVVGYFDSQNVYYSFLFARYSSNTGFYKAEELTMTAVTTAPKEDNTEQP